MLFPSVQLCMMFNLDADCVNIMPQGVQGGTHGQILLRACTVYISDSEPDKSGSLPESSRTNPTPDNFVFHTIV